MPGKKGFQKLAIRAKDGDAISVYAGAKVSAAFQELMAKLDDIYHGVRLAEVLRRSTIKAKKMGEGK